jgi:catechol 2,3-dioxygenase-like lactoylglutathione lyase family enzyme
MNRLALLIAFGVGTLAAQQEPAVVGVATFLHIVSDLDQALDFYHGTLGLELAGRGASPQPVDNPVVASMYGVPGQQYRAAVLKIPGTSLLVELVQWGPARKPMHDPAADPGVITLILRHSEAATASTTLHDPDGFPIHIEQSENSGADLSISVSDPGKTASTLSKVLGLKSEGEWFAVPGGAARIRLTKAGSSAGLAIPFPSPGRGSVRFMAHNVVGLAGKLTAAGLTVVTTGGTPVTLPNNGPQAIILREPSSFAVQLIETK